MKKYILTLFFIFFIITAQASEYHYKGKSAYIHRNYEKAREMFLKDIQISDEGDSYYFLGEIEKNDKNYDLSLEYFKKAVSAKKISRKLLVNSYWNIIIFYEQKGDYQNYIKYSRDFWQKTGERSAKQKIDSLINKLMWSDSQEAVDKYNEGISLLKKNDQDNAVMAFSQAINIDSNFLAPRFELGLISYKKGNYSEAARQFSIITERIPFYAEVQLLLGRINFSNKNYAPAAKNFDAALTYGFVDKKTEYDTILKRGICYYHTGDYENAEEDISLVADSSQNDLEPHLLLSAIYIKKGDFESALKYLAKAEKISPDNSSIIFQTGSIYYHKNDARFVKYFDKLFDMENQNPQNYESYIKAFKIIMDYHYQRQNYQRSFEIAQKNLSVVTQDYESILIAGRSATYLGKNEEAVSFFKKISIVESKDKLLYTKALGLSGKKNEALNILRTLRGSSAYLEAKEDKILKTYIDELEEIIKESNKQSQTNTTGM